MSSPQIYFALYTVFLVFSLAGAWFWSRRKIRDYRARDSSRQARDRSGRKGFEDLLFGKVALDQLVSWKGLLGFLVATLIALYVFLVMQKMG